MSANLNGSSRQSESNDTSKELFKSLKEICVPLLGNSRLQHQSTAKVSSLLSELIRMLESVEKGGVELKPSLISYIFLPLSTILTRNEPASIPDHIMEKIFISLRFIFHTWWLTCEIEIWEQVVMFASVILTGIDRKGKGKERDSETVESGVKLLLDLLEPPVASHEDDDARTVINNRLSVFRQRSQEARLVSVIGQALDSVLGLTSSQHIPLQLASLNLVRIIIKEYLRDDIIPTVLPGVVSVMTRVAITTQGKQWVNGEVVSEALKILEIIIIRALGDSVCLSLGIVKEYLELADLIELAGDSNLEKTDMQSENSPKYTTTRTTSWLRGTTSQLLMALNSLSSLVAHPNPTALLSLSSLSYTILSEAHLSLPQARSLLISFLLLLSSSKLDSVASHSRQSMLLLLSSSSRERHDLLQTIIKMTADNLASLPQALSSRSDAKVMRIAAQIEAVCNLTNLPNRTVDFSVAISTIRSGVGQLLGSNGHIEKWGWRLLNVLDLVEPIISASSNNTQLLLEDNLNACDIAVFPEIQLRYFNSKSTLSALESMLRALGRAGGEDCIFSVEWFFGVGIAFGNASSTAALLCACRILEGISGITLSDATQPMSLNKRTRLEKFARWLSKSISDLWDKSDMDGDQSKTNSSKKGEEIGQEQLRVEYSRGLSPVLLALNLKESSVPSIKSTSNQYMLLQRSLQLQLLCVAASALRTKFTTLLIYALYPILHSLVSYSPLLSSTAMASLQHITNSTGYASPANLLLSNFDYALDSVSRRLSRRWLDLSAPKVLVVLVRLVGKDIVQRAGDVVEECFDRLDDYHGYDVLVEGLVEVLHEVVKAVENEDPPKRDFRYNQYREDRLNANDSNMLDEFFHWYEHRNDPSHTEDLGETCLPSAEKDKEQCSEETKDGEEVDPLADPPQTPIQALTRQIVARSLYFLTHGSPLIRARILTLLGSAVPILPESALLPSVHKAWPFVLNRLSDAEPYVVLSAASFVEALVTHVGGFMTTRIWDDIWPRFQKLLQKLIDSDSQNALARRGIGAVGTETGFTASHRLYRSMMKTMTDAVKGIQIQDSKSWDVMIYFRRFLHCKAHEELQESARDLYVALAENNEDAVWLVLQSTLAGEEDTKYLVHLREPRWDVRKNVEMILASIDKA